MTGAAVAILLVDFGDEAAGDSEGEATLPEVEFLASAAAGAGRTVTMGLIFLIVFAGTLAFDKSDAEEYGLLAIIFFASAGPIPGKSLKSCSEDVFRC